ncbi:tRNA (adenosine(37)-N6)-threonylcarbamoyltransferase complex dimerization subunit type 1 TsaB [Synechococcus sp. RSCCF101]|uniref:tRNA (adenosine(37)-N6)-threonylcarbamoyltransferase complex dimerization subunit type 1 TsaB n=1 Tax=Synechococcus sp. RSCCF101 TaxID=2511069 RepID=UPI001248CB80|nr:tRNA (adenosine(37)-N6)-threonylcarbamoyltransferase complex dimerization subunit type 1 TsaB [Synechococcus sp. RSCCF101]QEY32886.1 tRNA (adenosine(37)-N6)-threonylcarbamoyltransferase complex dimerization subunit type 1 TsaB [Synechococcus sp. RSCCF101]
MTPSAAAPAPDGLILALHSSSSSLGVACAEAWPPEGGERVRCFPLGRALSTSLLHCVEEVLPAGRWPRLVRLAVATGPGGFTGTRLTVVMARTLAQQLGCPLNGISSFLLMAHRLIAEGRSGPGPFWIRQELPRRGFVVGRYGCPDGGEDPVELSVPHLVPLEQEAGWRDHGEPVHPFLDAVPRDVTCLLQRARRAHQGGQPAAWGPVLPIYPTSPVGGL